MPKSYQISQFDKPLCEHGYIEIDDKDGNKRYTTDIVADSVQFLESKGQSNGSNDNVTPYDYQEAPSNDVDVENDPFADFGDSVSIDDNFLD